MEIHINKNVEKFIESLEAVTVAKTLRTIDLLEKFGNGLGMPHSKRITRGIFELRVRGKQEIRILYCFYNNAVHLLHGFIKKSQKTPNKELFLAQERYKRLTAL